MAAAAISRWSTASVPRRQAFSYWQDAVVSAYLPLETRPQSRHAFAGSIELGAGARLAVSRVRSHPSEVHRTRAGIARAVNDSYFVNLVLSGHAGVSQAGTSERLAAGDLMVVDTNQPFLLDFSEGVDIVCVTLEGAALRRGLSRLRQPAIALHTPGLLKTLTASYIATLAHDLGSIGQHDEFASDQLGALLLKSLSASDDTPAAAKRHADLADQIKRFIRAGIADPGLGAKRICASLGLSRSVVFEAFAAESLTLAGFIRNERLARSRELLSSQRLPIEDIAHEVGFRDHSTFSRTFRREFGITPSSFRTGLIRK